MTDNTYPITDAKEWVLLRAIWLHSCAYWKAEHTVALQRGKLVYAAMCRQQLRFYKERIAQRCAEPIIRRTPDRYTRGDWSVLNTPEHLQLEQATGCVTYWYPIETHRSITEQLINILHTELRRHEVIYLHCNYCGNDTYAYTIDKQTGSLWCLVRTTDRDVRVDITRCFDCTYGKGEQL